MDDASTDLSYSYLCNLLEDYPNKKAHVKIIRHFENKGVAVSRKEAIEISKGEYIACCDSDDWYDKDAFTIIYNTISSQNSDIILYDYYEVLPNDHVNYRPLLGVAGKQNIQNISKSSILNYQLNTYLWSMFFKRDLIQTHNIIWPTGNISEDTVLMFQLAFYSNTITYLRKPLYYYYTNQNSLVRSKTIESSMRRFKESYKNSIIIEEFYKRQNLLSLYSQGLLLFKIKTKQYLCRYVNNSKYYQVWKDAFPEITLKRVLLSDIPVTWKLIYSLVYLRIYPLILRLAKKY